LKALIGFLMAWGMFSAIPCPSKKWDEHARGWMLIMLPLIGLILGGIWYGCLILLKMTSLPTAATAALMTAFPIVISGGIHTDGFMDVCDAILSRRPIEEKRKILKDSHNGSFAVIFLVIYFAVYFGFMCGITSSHSSVIAASMIVIPAVSRAASSDFIFSYRPLETSQYMKTSWEKDVKGSTAVIFIAIALMIVITAIMERYNTYAFFGENAAIMCSLLATLIVSAIAGAGAKKSLGGMSGDISGFMITLGELAGVVCCSIFTIYL